MPGHFKRSCGCVSRRKFLSFAAASTALVFTDNAKGALIGETLSPIGTDQAVKALPGGISPRRFEEAKRRAADIVVQRACAGDSAVDHTGGDD
jgi:hypothetical protein